MPGKPAARIADPVAHLLPPVLMGGPTALNVLVGGLPAWRAIPTAAVAALQSTQKTIDTALRIAENVAVAAAPTPGGPAARLAAEAAKAAAAAAFSSSIVSAAAGSDVHCCLTPWPLPPHGAGVDIDGSPTVMVTGRHKIARQGDQILEAIGGMSSIVGGCPTVLVGCAGTTGNVPAGIAACVAARSGRNPPPGTVDNNGNPIAGNTPGQSYNNCGIESSRQIINQTGGNATQEGLLNQSMASGDATQVPGSLFQSGGTDPGGRQNILAANGVPSHLEAGNMGNLQTAVANGDGVIASVWAGNMPNWAVSPGPGQPAVNPVPPGTGGHAILVTGVEYDDNGNPINVYINDTGMGQCGQKIPYNQFQNALRPGRDLNVTNNPIW
jgi:hypothetical protein